MHKSEHDKHIDSVIRQINEKGHISCDSIKNDNKHEKYLETLNIFSKECNNGKYAFHADIFEFEDVVFASEWVFVFDNDIKDVDETKCQDKVDNKADVKENDKNN